MKWKGPKPLLYTVGKDWVYQASEEIKEILRETLPGHYKAWKDRAVDKQLHPLYLLWSGPGTGKSRTLEEFQSLCCMSVSDPELRTRVTDAYVFKVL